MIQLRMLDLFSGVGGANRAMRERGWSVISVDRDFRRQPDIVGDVLDLPVKRHHVDLLWASIPCEEFARHSMPWLKWKQKKGELPSLALALEVLTIREFWKPTYFVFECSQLSRKWLTPLFGRVSCQVPGHTLWSNLPLLIPNIPAHKERQSGKHPELRARVPYEISITVAKTVEHLIFKELRKWKLLN